jgi:molecular chaperone DnaK
MNTSRGVTGPPRAPAQGLPAAAAGAGIGVNADMSEIAIGIDLGTSNSCVAVMRGGGVDVLPNAYGENTTASVVAFREDGAINVGNAAKANIIHNPTRTVHSSKRLIGRYFFSEEVKKAQAICSYQIVDAENHALRIKVDEELFSLPEIAGMILSEMKSIAEARLGQPVSKAVITVPAYFNDNQRQATKDAGRIAGLEVLRILNEPTAAALAYGFGRGLSQRVAVWDLGGGTFDISVLEIGEDVFEVLSTSGDTFLGGEDFDDRLIDLLADEFTAATGLNLRNDPYALEKLKVAAEGAKKGLSVEDEVEIRIPDVIRTKDGATHSIERRLTSTEYTVLVNDLIQRTFKVCDEALQQAGIVARDLDGVILVGGPTRLPIVRDAVRDYFQQDPKGDVDPDEVVAMGAAIHAASLVNPDQEAYLLDVTPLSLRIGIAGGLAETVIERNTPVPIEQTRTFTTLRDMQESVSIRVYQGESQEEAENELLGQFSFSDFAKAARGEVEIDVSFEINTDGIVNVTATDRATGKAASTSITLSSGLSNNELEAIIEEGRTDRLEPTTRTENGEVIGAIPLRSVRADTPVVFEETRASKRELLGDDEDELLPLDEEPPVAAAPAEEVLEIDHAPMREVVRDEPDTEEMKAYVDSLPEDALDLEADGSGEDLELLGNDETPEEIELDDAVEIATRDEQLDLGAGAGVGETDPALRETVPALETSDLFDVGGTDLSEADDDPEEIR